jgi:hypothetical protein
MTHPEMARRFTAQAGFTAQYAADHAATCAAVPWNLHPSNHVLSLHGNRY